MWKHRSSDRTGSKKEVEGQRGSPPSPAGLPPAHSGETGGVHTDSCSDTPVPSLWSPQTGNVRSSSAEKWGDRAAPGRGILPTWRKEVPVCTSSHSEPDPTKVKNQKGQNQCWWMWMPITLGMNVGMVGRACGRPWMGAALGLGASQVHLSILLSMPQTLGLCCGATWPLQKEESQSPSRALMLTLLQANGNPWASFFSNPALLITIQKTPLIFIKNVKV